MNMNDSTQASITSVTSKPSFTKPNSPRKRWAMTFTKYSPDTMATLTLTSNAMPTARMKQPTSRLNICMG